MNARAKLVTKAETRSIVIEVARSLEGFSGLEREWDELYERSNLSNPFLSFAWTSACLDEDGSCEPFIVTLRKSGELIGIAPLCIERKLGFRLLRFIADDRSDYLGFLFVDGPEAVERRLLWEFMRYEEEFDLIVLRKLAEPFTALPRISKPDRANWTKVEWTTSAYCHWNGDWNSLHENGPLWLKQMRNRRKRFLKNGRSVERFTGAEAAARLDLVASIEASSWKGRQGVARLQPGAGQEILKRSFLKLGSQMELWLAFAEGQAIAFQIDFIAQNCLWLYQFSYREEFASLRAGSVIGYSSIERAWLNGVREYDFLTGDESYKTSRTTALRPIHHLAGYPKNLRGRLAYSMLIAPRWRLREIPVLKAAYTFLKSMVQRLSKGIRSASS